ncbi:MAG: hypothetical protein JXB04_09930 [Kiritimatiellae bacterium]|nr:hypothetical protein [Kiritimatiellia bacterium]
MSLIQEALRRRDEEEGRKPAGRSGAVPPRVELPRREKPPRGWLAVVSLLLVILVVLAAGVGLLYFVVRSTPGLDLPWKGAAPAPPGPVAVTPPRPADAGARVEEPVPPPISTAGLPAGEPPARSTPAGMPYGVLPSASLADRPLETAPPPASAAPRAAAEPAPRPSAIRQTPVTREPDHSVQEAPRPPGTWPRLKVMGVLTKGPAGEGSVIINGDIIEVDEQVEGVTVREVDTSGVWLEYGGRRRFVKVGRSTR